MAKPRKSRSTTSPDPPRVTRAELIRRLPDSPDEFDRTRQVQALREKLASMHPDHLPRASTRKGRS